jgi:hypothetical protein
MPLVPIRKQQFDDRAIAYMRSELMRYGGIRRELLELDLGSGTAFAYWPTDVPVNESDDLKYWFYDPRDDSPIDPRIEGEHHAHALTIMADYLNGQPNRYLFVQTTHWTGDRRNADGSIRVAPGQELIGYTRGDQSPPDGYPDEYWVFLTAPSASDEDVRITFARGSLHPPTVGIVTQLPSDRLPVHEQFLDREFVRAIVAGVRWIIFDAFDHQLLVFWERGT